MVIKRIDKEKCNGCRICVDACPADVIRFDEENNVAVIRYAKDCICCYNCEQDCPIEAIYVDPMRDPRVPAAW